MKTKIHPQYHKDAKYTCSNCGAEFAIGGTQKDIKVEICANCHHFWTGEEKNISQANRVDRFSKRMAKVAPKKEKAEAAK
jgi:large subunit ribosomal protein L31